MTKFMSLAACAGIAALLVTPAFAQSRGNVADTLFVAQGDGHVAAVYSLNKAKIDLVMQNGKKLPAGTIVYASGSAIWIAQDGPVMAAKMADSKMSEPKMADGKMADGKMADAKMADAKMAEPKMSDSKMADMKMADAGMADGKMADGKMADGKMADGKMMDTKMADPKMLSDLLLH